MTARRSSYVVVFGLALFGPCVGRDAFAQTPEGQAVPWDRAASSARAAPKKVRPLNVTAAAAARAKTVAKAPPLAPWAAVDPDRVAPSPLADQEPSPPQEAKSATESAADRLRNAKSDLAMKWRGNNDTQTQTRVQNLDGNAQGTGAEVGLKLHF